jgi:hypothetical protein
MNDDSIRVGYINDDRQHALISIKNPAVTSQYPRPEIVQAAIDIERAALLHDILGEFLLQHGIETAKIRVSPAMIDAGLEELMGHFPDSASGYDGRAVCAIFTAMCAARGLPEREPEGPLLEELMVGLEP